MGAALPPVRGGAMSGGGGLYDFGLLEWKEAARGRFWSLGEMETGGQVGPFSCQKIF